MDDTLTHSCKHWMNFDEHLKQKEFERIYKEFAGRAFAKVEDWGNTDEDEVLWRSSSFINDLYKDGRGTIDLQPVAVQQEFNVEIAGVPVKGFIDCVEGTKKKEFAIRDYKVTGNPRFLTPGKSLQLKIYAVATGIWEVGFLIFDKKKGTVQWKSSSLDPEQTKREVEL